MFYVLCVVFCVLCFELHAQCRLTLAVGCGINRQGKKMYKDPRVRRSRFQILVTRLGTCSHDDDKFFSAR